MKTLTAAFALALAILLPDPAWGQTLCNYRDVLLAGLARTYGEVVVAQGVTLNGQVVERLESDKGTWTLIVSSPSGWACFIAAGEGWQPVKPVRGEPS